MSTSLEVKIPDLGDVDEVEVVEILVKVGDQVDEEQSLITLESDKASMDVPSPAAGTVQEIKIAPGAKVTQGHVILILANEASAKATAADEAKADEAKADEAKADEAKADEAKANEAKVPADEAKADEAKAPADQAKANDAKAERSAPANTPADSTGFDDAARGADLRCDVMVLGSGPGGYTAAFRAADLGLEVVLVERYPTLGGVCLNVGCIPSKALLHMAKVIDDARAAAEHGVSFGEPTLDLDRLRTWKNEIVGKLTGGLTSMAKQRKVTTLTGTGTLTGPHSLSVMTDEGERTVAFRHAILAAGSRPVMLPGFPADDPRLMDSTGALELQDVPGRLLVIGGGIIGLEMSQVYAALGSKITVVELLPNLMPGADKDLLRPLQKRLEARYENIWTKTKVTRLEAEDEGLRGYFEGGDAPESAVYDRVLLSVGRIPNGKNLGAEAAGVEVDARGFIHVDKQQRTNVPHIFAIGDLVGQPMLAHKATHEAKVAAEVAAGHKSYFDARVIPSVAYTDPEVAWVGVTETEAKESGQAYEKGSFPWAASGRALASGAAGGTTKLLFDPETKKVIGGGIVGPHAGDLIAEVALAIEMGCDAEDIGLTIHPHPTLSETIAFAAEAFEGTITDLYLPKKKPRPKR